MKSTSIAIICAGLLLSGCGGITEVAQVYAQPGDVVGLGSSFATQDVKRFVVVDGTHSLKDQTIAMSISDDGNTVFVTQNFKDYIMVLDGALGAYIDGSAILFREVSGAGVVETVYFGDSAPGYFNAGSFVIGYHTDPVQVAAQTGSATYNGYTYLTARTAALDGFAEGAVVLNVNFGTDTVTGTMTIVDSAHPGADFIVPDTVVTINPGDTANITGNLFITDLSFVFSPAPGDTFSVDQTGLTGGFYGVDAVAVGASYWGTGMLNGENLFIEGALASD